MTSRRRPSLLATASVLLATLVAACGSSSPASGPSDAGTFDAGPVQGSYTIIFPSLAAAVNADSIQVFVFEAGDAQTQCSNLLSLQKGGGTLPPVVAGSPSEATTPCKLESGAGNLSLGFGSYAVLVVAQKGGADIAVGCQQETLTEAAPTMSITLEILNVPVTTLCTTLSAFCANTCM